MNKRREQFNFRTSLLSDEAYHFLEHLSETRQLSKQIAAWAQQELSNQSYTPQNHTSTEILKEIREIKKMLRSTSIHTQNPLNLEFHQYSDNKIEALQLVSSDQVHNVIEDDDELYDY